MGVATACSTVSASAPTYVPFTAISGGTMLGYWATGRLRKETTPTITMMMAITMATIGREIKNLDIGNLLHWEPPKTGRPVKSFAKLPDFLPSQIYLSKA